MRELPCANSGPLSLACAARIRLSSGFGTPDAVAVDGGDEEDEGDDDDEDEEEEDEEEEAETVEKGREKAKRVELSTFVLSLAACSFRTSAGTLRSSIGEEKELVADETWHIEDVTEVKEEGEDEKEWRGAHEDRTLTR